MADLLCLAIGVTLFVAALAVVREGRQAPGGRP